MKRVRPVFFAWLLVLFLGCGAETDEGKTVVIITRPDGEQPLDGSEPVREYAAFSLCSVNVRFVLENGTGRELQFENGNDTTVVVEIRNTETGGLLARNCLWAKGQDRETARFDRGDALRIEVFQGQGEFWHWTCVKGMDALLNNFPLCDEAEVLLR